MPDPVLHLGDQTEVVPAPGRPAGRRPWHPSQGGAPWDVEKSSSEAPSPARPSNGEDSDWGRICPRECHYPACRHVRPVRRRGPIAPS
jgi:hypothetical protein